MEVSWEATEEEVMPATFVFGDICLNRLDSPREKNMSEQAEW